MRRLDDYDPDEGGRYDGDDAGHGSRFNRPEWLAIVLEQEAAKLAVFEEAIARTNALYHTPQPGEIACGTCGGAGTLKDLSLALFVGMAAGAYSSIFIATPLLCQLMERQPQMQALAKRVASRGAGAQPRSGKSAPSGSGNIGGAEAAEAVTSVGAGTTTAVAESSESAASDAMERARARRASSGPRNQPKRSSKSKR